MSEFSLSKKGLDPVVAEHRPVLADEGGAELTVPAEPDPAFHVAFHGQVDVLAGDAALQKLQRGESHHHLRPAHHGQGAQRIEGWPGGQGGEHPRVAAPAAGGPPSPISSGGAGTRARTGRRGPGPMPPATMTRSLPKASSTGHGFPKG